MEAFGLSYKEKINAILVREFEVDPGLVGPSARLRDDLSLDSLDEVDLMVAIEKEFAVRLEESSVRKMQTVEDIYRHIERLQR